MAPSSQEAHIVSQSLWFGVYFMAHFEATRSSGIARADVCAVPSRAVPSRGVCKMEQIGRASIVTMPVAPERQ